MLRWSHHVDIFGTLHFIVRCLADRSEGPLPPCSCRRRRCSCTPPASASSPTSAKDIESRPNHVNSWSPAREEPMGNIHTYIIIIIIMRQDHQLPAQLGLHVVVSSSINKWQCHKYPTLQQRFQTKSMMTYIHTYIIIIMRQDHQLPAQ